MEKELENALKIVRDNGYIYKKWTIEMEKDAQECEESDCSKDCAECSCNMCISQQKGKFVKGDDLNIIIGLIKFRMDTMSRENDKLENGNEELEHNIEWLWKYRNILENLES